ncbi:excalibur calcium-binding domain-containing protein [Modestobacter sp. VKM Ac-2986]|uniref:excalibur calcium-binding domain-containing protein n=1 Tax=Modestobacter sp. VKM Ac-2986 TaxID=3004140 RepID=UPI0022ABADDE|nr:excalibur calcium-binding domain-containing protein [Modestobacter sp. VKM Ac-2986]MCZ2830804.1 excalibur calcium-binding domain-containing protein [Modestobacter sp. VKM Ac-2986]
MRIRRTALALVLAAGISAPLTGTASAADRDCPDFASQADAQAAYNAVAGDPERLDRDNDGIACETEDYDAAAAPAPAPAAAPAAAAPAAAPAPQVAARPAGAVAAGDGSSDSSSTLPYVLGGLAFAGAGGAAMAARRSRSNA